MVACVCVSLNQLNQATELVLSAVSCSIACMPSLLACLLLMCNSHNPTNGFFPTKYTLSSQLNHWGPLRKQANRTGVVPTQKSHKPCITTKYMLSNCIDSPKGHLQRCFIMFYLLQRNLWGLFGNTFSTTRALGDDQPHFPPSEYTTAFDSPTYSLT